MKRLCVLCIALFVCLMAMPVLATETRVQTMGDQQLFIQDDFNIWTWTSTVNNYPRHLIVDHNDAYTLSNTASGSTRVGMIVPFMKNAVLGAFVSDGTFGEPLSLFAPVSAAQRIDLFYGYRASSFDLGVHVDWWGNKTEAGTTESSASVMGLQAGLGFNASGNMFEVDAFYRNLDFTDDPGADARDAGTWLGAAGRYLWAYNNMVTIVPAVQIQQIKLSDTASPVTEVKGTLIDLGLGCNTVPLQGTEFMTSLGIMVQSREATTGGTPSVDSSVNTIPYIKIGADIQVKDWLFFRVGAQKNVVQTEKDNIAPESQSTNSNLTYSIGAGIMLGDVQFDARVDNQWLNDGPYLLSGDNNSTEMFPSISFKYDFR
jgi:hypothetical protein